MSPESSPEISIPSLEQIWPPELLYFRRMGSREISEYLEVTPTDKRLVLIVWGVLEAHGPWLPVASDSMQAQVATDKVAHKLYHEYDIQPIIYNSFTDIGSYSATRDFPGAVAIEGWEEYKPGNYSPMVHIWEKVISRLKKEGFQKFFLVNGDGGNWMNYFERIWEESFPSLRDYIADKFGVTFDGANWDQEGGMPWKHAGHHAHAFINWLCNFAPDFERLAAIRAGLKPVPEKFLKTIDRLSTGLEDLETVKRRRSNWADFPQQKELRAVSAPFSFSEYQKLLYEDDGVTPRSEGGIARDFEEKIESLMAKVLKVADQTL